MNIKNISKWIQKFKVYIPFFLHIFSYNSNFFKHFIERLVFSIWSKIYKSVTNETISKPSILQQKILYFKCLITLHEFHVNAGHALINIPFVKSNAIIYQFLFLIKLEKLTNWTVLTVLILQIKNIDQFGFYFIFFFLWKIMVQHKIMVSLLLDNIPSTLSP